MIMDRPTRKIPGNEATEGAAAMSTVGQIVRKNANGLLTTHPKESVFAALEIMAKHDIGALVVMDGGMLAGLFTERDYARKVILKGRNSRECSVGELMGDAVRVGPGCMVADALALMASRDRRTRYLVVGDGSVLEGVVSIGDLVKAQMSQQQATIEALEHYITSPG
jgi:CBS domain-containing protein